MESVECGAHADGRAEGWRGYRADEPGEEPLVIFYCPTCAEAEFGDAWAGDLAWEDEE